MGNKTGKGTSRRSVTVAICGNPNCGKTTIFNAITGLRQKVGNYPGVTVEKVSGQFRVETSPETAFELVDIPGTYSLAAFSPDEYIAAQALAGGIDGEAKPDVIICTIDATNLERGLYLLFQVLQIGSPVVVALNMVDVAIRRGLRINTTRLSRLLHGLSIIPVVASRGKGINRLKAAVGQALNTPVSQHDDWYDQSTTEIISEISGTDVDKNRSRAEYIRVLYDLGGPAEKAFLSEGDTARRELLDSWRRKIIDRFGALSAGETLPLTDKATALYGEVVSHEKTGKRSRSDRIDRVLLHPVLGPIIMLAIMTLIFQSIFKWAQPVVELFDRFFGALGMEAEGLMTDGPLRSLLIDGVIGGVGSVLVFLPQIIILFLFIAILEDSGYMPRAAFLVDRIFGWCGLSGKSFIPMLSSFACAIPGIMATRTIEDRKLRLITIMVSPLMSCSARLPVYAIMIAAFIPHKSYLTVFNSQGLVLTALYLMGIVLAVIVSSVLNRVIFRTERTSFLMEMPTYKTPTAQSILIRVYSRARSFVIRAGTVIFAITVIIWALSYYPRSPEIAEEHARQRTELEAAYQTRLETQGSRFEALSAENAEITQQDIEGVQYTLEEVVETEQLQQVERELLTERPEAADVVRLLIAGKRAELDHESEMMSLANQKAGEYIRNSYFGRIGRAIEPVFVPLGWDWRITMATLASFPAREVIIATLGTIFNLGSEVGDESSSLVDKMRLARWESGSREGQPLFTPAVALSIMVFFALCCQCGATLVTIKQETSNWLYSVVVFVYMSALAYTGAFLVYQVISRMGGL